MRGKDVIQSMVLPGQDCFSILCFSAFPDVKPFRIFVGNIPGENLQ